MLFGPWPPITGKLLSAERNRLLAAFVLLLAVNLAMGTTFHYGLPWERFGGYGGLLLAGAKLVYTYIVFRLSKVLRQPLWMTALYTVLAPIAGFELIPLVALFFGARMARGMLDER